MGYKRGTSEYEQIEKLKAKEDWILEGTLGRAFPCTLIHSRKLESGSIDGDLKEVSENFNSDTKTKLSPFEGAGVMIGREFVTTRVIPDCDSEAMRLRDILSL